MNNEMSSKTAHYHFSIKDNQLVWKKSYSAYIPVGKLAGDAKGNVCLQGKKYKVSQIMSIMQQKP
jgi:hypothetical protein